jgi:hypothetical protein
VSQGEPDCIGKVPRTDLISKTKAVTQMESEWNNCRGNEFSRKASFKPRPQRDLAELLGPAALFTLFSTITALDY